MLRRVSGRIMSTARKLENIISPPPSDIAIAQSVKPLPIADIAKSLGVNDEELEPYGFTKAKVSLDVLNRPGSYVF